LGRRPGAEKNPSENRLLKISGIFESGTVFSDSYLLFFLLAIYFWVIVTYWREEVSGLGLPEAGQSRTKIGSLEVPIDSKAARFLQGTGPPRERRANSTGAAASGSEIGRGPAKGGDIQT